MARLARHRLNRSPRSTFSVDLQAGQYSTPVLPKFCDTFPHVASLLYPQRGSDPALRRTDSGSELSALLLTHPPTGSTLNNRKSPARSPEQPSRGSRPCMQINTRSGEEPGSNSNGNNRLTPRAFRNYHRARSSPKGGSARNDEDSVRKDPELPDARGFSGYPVRG